MAKTKVTKLTTCKSFEEVLDAAIALCAHPYIVVECAPTSDLLRLCLTTPVVSASKEVYVFDFSTAGFDSHTRTVLAALLTRSEIIKVVWDGAETHRNVVSALGINNMFPILDLQMLEVIERADEGRIQGNDQEGVALATFGSGLVLRNRERLAGSNHRTLSIDACVTQYAPDVPQPTFAKRFKKQKDLFPLVEIATRLCKLVYIIRAFVLAKILPDINANRVEFEDIVKGLSLLLERSNQYITIDRSADGVVSFDQQLIPVAAVTSPPLSVPSPPSMPAVPRRSTTAAKSPSTASSAKSLPRKPPVNFRRTNRPYAAAIVRHKVYSDGTRTESVDYEFCVTPASILSAVSVVSQHPYVLIDCEGKQLGSTDGVLSIISLGTPLQQQSSTDNIDVNSVQQQIFLIDVLALKRFTDTRPRAAIATLLTSSIAKVVWDGRMDAIELSQHFCSPGAPPEPVIDLQIAEVIFGRGRDEAERRTRLAQRMGVRKLMRKHNSATAALFDNLYVVLGLGSIPEVYGIDTPVAKLKDAQEALFGDEGGVLERPAPELLLDYAAVDTRLLARVCAHFAQHGIVPIGDMPALKRLIALSTRYVSRNDIGGRAVQNPFRIGWLLSLDAIRASLKDAAVCKVCGARMPQKCFNHTDRARREQCRVCVVAVLSEKKSEALREAAKSFHATWVEDHLVSGSES